MDDTRFYDLYIGSRASAALVLAVQVGLIDWLASGPHTARDVGAHFHWRPRPTDTLLTALTTMGVLQRVDAPDPGALFVPGDAYALTPEARRFLVSGQPEDLSGLIAMDYETFITPQGLLEALTHDRPVVYGNNDPWDRHREDGDRARFFARAMRSISARPAEALARMELWRDCRHLVDVGGGSGIYAVAALRWWPELRATVVDMAPVCPLAEDLAREDGVLDRLTTTALDMFDDAWPEGDVVLLSQILHDWSPERGRELLRRAHAALPPGGVLLLHEKLLAPSREAPMANALVNVDMLYWTEGQQYSRPQLERMLVAAGFADVMESRTTGYWSLVRARRV